MSQKQKWFYSDQKENYVLENYFTLKVKLNGNIFMKLFQ